MKFWIILISMMILFSGCNQTSLVVEKPQQQKQIKNYKKVENPYKNLREKEQITALTNYFIQKEFNKIKKPTYPKKPQKPYIKPAKALIKSRFETTSNFQKRVQKARIKRENYITKLEKSYKDSVLKYNKDVQKLTDDYNKQVKNLKEQMPSITAKAMSRAYGIVYGKPLIKSVDYDADNEIYYGELSSSKGNFNKKIAIKVPLNIAKNFYDGKKNIDVVYEYKNNKIYLKDIKVRYKNKNYLAMLTDKDYKTDEVKVAINTRKLNLKTSKLLNSTFKANTQDFDIGSINYAQSKVAKLNVKDLEALNKQRLKHLQEDTENLSSLLQKAKAVKKNPKAYAVIFGIEDYMLEPNVSYSQNSAMMFMQYTSKLLGVPDEHIWAFIGNKTSTGFIKSQWNDFLNNIEDGAIVYFYYSGHGVPDVNGNAYILPSDTSAEAIMQDKTFMLKNIYANLSKTPAKRVIAFVDSCFSGKDEKGKLLFEGVAPVIRVKKTIFDSSKMTVFTAGGSQDFSNQYKEKKQRLFSYYLMKGLALGKKDTRDLYLYVKNNVSNKSRKLGARYKQIPQLSGKRDGEIR